MDGSGICADSRGGRMGWDGGFILRGGLGGVSVCGNDSLPHSFSSTFASFFARSFSHSHLLFSVRWRNRKDGFGGGGETFIRVSPLYNSIIKPLPSSYGVWGDLNVHLHLA